MTLQAIRDELATLVPEGYEVYSTLPASAKLPAVVIDLPERITPDGSYRFSSIEMRIIVVLGAAFGREVEETLLVDAIAISKVYAGINGNSFRSCMVNSIDSFYTVPVGNKEALSAQISLTLLAEI